MNLLIEREVARGAVRASSPSPADAGATITLSYGDPAAEARALLAGVGLVDLSHRGLLRVAGRDRVRFLQAMTTSDVAACAPGHGVYGALLNDKGRVVADLSILVEADAVWLDVEAAARAKLPAVFDRYIIMDDVEITDYTDRRALLAVHGPGAHDALQAALVADVPMLADRTYANVAGHDVWRRDRVGVPGYEVDADPERAPALFDAIVAAGATLVGDDAFERVRIDAGIPRAFVDMDESTILLEAGLERLAPREKGCYLGQEIIVRALDRGGVRRLLRGLVLDAAAPVPSRGTPVALGEREVGRVSSAALSPGLGRPVALAILTKDALAPGTEVRVGDQAARVVDLPFQPR